MATPRTSRVWQSLGLLSLVVFFVLTRSLLITPLLAKINHAEVMSPVRKAMTEENRYDDDTILLSRLEISDMERQWRLSEKRLQVGNIILDLAIIAVALVLALPPRTGRNCS